MWRAFALLLLVAGDAYDQHGHGHAEHGHEHHDHGHQEHGHEHHDHGHQEHGHEHHDHGHQEHGHEHHDHGHQEHGHEHHDHGDQEHGHGHGEHGHAEHGHSHKPALSGGAVVATATPSRVWAEALFGTFVISAGGNVLILYFMSRPLAPQTLNVMVAFAAGGLLGDAFLHLLPHAQEGSASGGHNRDHGHGHSHDHGIEDLSSGLWVLFGILAFFVLEKALPLLGVGHEHQHGHGHEHKKHSSPPPPPTSTKGEDKTPTLRQRKMASTSSTSLHKAKPTDSGARATGRAKKDKRSWISANLAVVRPGALLNMLADGVHNFTDGLAIGASFAAGFHADGGAGGDGLYSNALGISTTLAVLFHEIPHEIGDFAVLLSQGFTPRGALLAQCMSALGAFAGCGVGVFMSLGSSGAAGAGAGGSHGGSAGWILSLTAGGFIYIALVDILPGLLHEGSDDRMGTSGGFWQLVKEVMAICAGIVLMILVALLE